MAVKVVFMEQVFEDLKKALEWDGKEKIVYILCHSSTSEFNIKIMPYKLFIPDEKDYVLRSSVYYEIDKPFINKVLNEAVETESDFIQAHIHPGDPGVFSRLDEEEELKLMRHFADKIEGIYHASLVFGNSLEDLTLDGWFYDRKEDCIIPIEKVSVIGKHRFNVHVPSRSSLNNIELPLFLDRSVKAFGEDAVRKLRMIDFGVVGVSALGAPIVEFLTRDRVKSLLMCDPDVIEETNLNRLPVSTLSDIGKPKVDFYEEYVGRVSPQIQTTKFQASFYDEGVQDAFSQVDVIFGCVDSGARLSINRLAMANLIPYFDMGAGIHVVGDKPEFVGGQVYSIIPGREICLHCSGAFQNLMAEFLSPEEREMEIRQGYLIEDKVVNPLVHFLDYTIAGLGYYQMLKYLWGVGNNDIFKVHYNGAKEKIQYSTCGQVGCINCQGSAYLGKGDKVPFFKPKKLNDFDLRLLEGHKREIKEYHLPISSERSCE